MNPEYDNLTGVNPMEEDSREEDSDNQATTATSYSRAVHYRQTRRRGGKIIKQVTERYIRGDLGFGITYKATGDDIDRNGYGNHVDEKLKKRLHKEVDQVAGRPHVISTVQELLTEQLVTNDDDNIKNSKIHPNNSIFALVVVDTNVLLHNLDVLEKAVLSRAMPNIVIPQTALLECRANRLTAYDRTVDLLRSVQRQRSNNETLIQPLRQYCPIFFPDQNHVATASPSKRMTLPNVLEQGPVNTTNVKTVNDENDAQIRRVAHYFGEHTRATNLKVILLTDDKDCRQKAQQESPFVYQAHSVASWVKILEQANPGLSLSDLVANFANTSGATAGSTSETLFSAHVTLDELTSGMQQGRYHRGCFRVTSQSANGERTGSVTIRQGEDRVAVTIVNANDANRAIDGDIVAIAIHPVEQWINAATLETGAVKPATTDNDGAGIASETAEPTQADLDNVPDNIAMATDGGGNKPNISMMRPTGKVVGIVRRNFASYSGSIYETATIENDETKGKDNRNKVSGDLAEREEIASRYEREHADGTFTCVFFAVDRKVPPILIRTTQRGRLLGQRIVVAMDSWPLSATFPLGHYVRTIGPAGSKDVETQVLLQEHNIPHEPFAAAVLACLPPEDYQIGNDNSPGRLDLRHLPVLSIDPPGCKDIDDALHCLKLPNGNYQIGVHIADVTHYVKPGTAIDLEAANRSTSTYLVNKRLDMLPGLLTTDLCSLKGNADRYAFSVLWEVTEDAEIVDVEFHKTLVHSVGALTYQQAQSLIDQPDDPNDTHACAVKRLALLARKFRKRRIDAGALTLASPEVKFLLDSESLNPTDVQAYALLEANAVVEEFMLLANVTVSKKILRHYPTLSVLRRHPAPNRAMFDSLISKAKCKGLSINIDDSKRLADSLDAARVESDPYVNKLLRILSTRCMSPAQYFCSGEFPPTEWHHYGLAAPVYTHFTSPIRRYADVCVHRLLAAAINVAPLPPRLSSKSYLHDLCANMNRRHRSAQMAGRASVHLHTLIFFAGDDAKEEYAYVLDVETAEASTPSFTVIVPRYGIEGRVRLTFSASDPRLSRVPKEHKIEYGMGTGSKVSVQVFDKVKVRIWVKETQDHRRELILDLVEPCFDRKGEIVCTSNQPNVSEASERPKKKAKT